MCSSEAEVTIGVEVMAMPVSKINGRPVLQPSTCNRAASLERPNSIKNSTKRSPPSPPPLPPTTATVPTTTYKATNKESSPTRPISPKSKSPRPQAIKRVSVEANGLNSSTEKVVTSPSSNAAVRILERKKSKSFKDGLDSSVESSLSYPSSLITEAPGRIAAVRREQVALQQAQRKMRIAHYGRSKSAKFEAKIVPLDASNPAEMTSNSEEEKRCSFITPNSDPIYAAYHDEEWGVPVHDDKMLFELLVLSGAQVGSDWTSILRKRQDFRKAFSEFDAEAVAKLTDRQISSISSDYGIDISQVRGVVDNSKRILEIKKEFMSFDKYIWGFVNQKPISTNYKFGHKMPVKTSKSDSISKDMVRRGFRLVGPTVVHSFMQAAGLTNDHLITCHRHLPCTLMATSPSRKAPMVNI